MPAGSSNPTKQTKRQRKGEALRTDIKAANRKQHGIVAGAAREALAEEHRGKELKARMVQQRAGKLADLLFETGGWAATVQVLQSFLNRGEVRTLLGTGESTKEARRQKARELLINSAKEFIHDCLTHGPGRRNLQDTNAFWAILAALVPEQVFDERLGETVGKLLGVSYRNVRKALDMRHDIEESASGWQFVRTNKHYDSIEVAKISEWLHTEGTTEDNANKIKHRVYHDDSTSNATSIGAATAAGGPRQYEEHWRRYFNDTIKNLHRQFLASDTFAKLKVEHEHRVRSNPRRFRRLKTKAGKAIRQAIEDGTREPLGADAFTAAVKAEAEKMNQVVEPLVVGIKLFRSAICPCMRHRSEAQCECQLCSYISYNIRRLHRLRHQSHKEAAASGTTQCAACSSCATCGNCFDPNSSGRQATANPAMLERFLLCAPVRVPGYDITLPAKEEGSPPVVKEFCCHKHACCTRGLREDDGACCGIAKRFPVCDVDNSDVMMKWFRWVPMERGKDSSGAPYTCMEFVPHTGTRAEFLQEFREKLAQWLSHRLEIRWTRKNWKMIEHLRQTDDFYANNVATVSADFASQVCVYQRTWLCILSWHSFHVFSTPNFCFCVCNRSRS